MKPETFHWPDLSGHLSGGVLRLSTHCSVQIRPYSGELRKIGENVTIRKNDLIGQLHLDDDLERLEGLTPVAKLESLTSSLLTGLHIFAQEMVDGDIPDDIKAVYGVSHLISQRSAPFLEKIGFTVTEPQTFGEKAVAGISAVLHSGKEIPGNPFVWLTHNREVMDDVHYLVALGKRRSRNARIIWMPTDTLLQKYATPEDFVETVNVVRSTDKPFSSIFR